MLYSYILASTAVFATVFAAPGRNVQYQTFEKVHVPRGWAVDSMPIDSDSHMSMKIHLVQTNVDAFEKKVIEISTPDHPDYGLHMSSHEIKEMLQPSSETHEKIAEWLNDSGASYRIDDDWVFIDDICVKDAEKLLSTKYQTFKHQETGERVARTLEYKIPAHLHRHVNMVHPTTMFGNNMKAMRKMISDISDVVSVDQFPEGALPAAYVATTNNVHDGLNVTACNSTITPDCLAALYKFKHFRPSKRNGNVMAAAGYLEEYYQEADLLQFEDIYKKKAAGTLATCIGVNGGKCTQHPDSDFVEANLDVLYAVGITYPTPNLYYSTGGRPPTIFPPNSSTNVSTNEPYLEWLQYMLAQPTVPQTITTSYGDEEQSVPEGYARTVCNLFAQLGARGVSILFSSGDSGPGSECSSIDGKNTTMFVPTFPASCPWVTSVGATYRVLPERAVSFSSGGFSNYFSRPAYQDTAVSTYLAAHGEQFAQYYNASGRGMPDVSAQGVYFHTIVNGSDQLVSGTSASSPAFAAVISLVNSDRLSNGQAPLGFLNPWLYQNAAPAGGLTDIVVGTSKGCAGRIPGAGFAAVPGWDPSTGLGTPNFKIMQEVSRADKGKN